MSPGWTVVLIVVLGSITIGAMIAGIWLSALGRLPLGLAIMAFAFAPSVPIGFLACDLDPGCACVRVAMP